LKKLLIKNRSTVFNSWLLSYIFVLFVPIAVSSFIYVKAVDIVKEQVNLTNKALLKQVQENLDSQMKDAMRIAYQIYLNPRLHSAMYYKGELSTSQRYAMFGIIDDLKSYQTLNSAIENIYIYFKNADLVLSTSVLNSPEDFFKIYHSNKNMSYEQWFKEISSSSKLKYITLESLTNSEEDDTPPIRTIAAIQPLPVGSKGDSPATLVILMDEKRFSNAIQGTKLVKQGEVCIIDDQNNIMASTSAMHTFNESISYDKLESDVIRDYVDANNSKVTVSCIASSFLRWKYISIVPENIFMDKVHYIRRLTIVSMLVCMIIGIVIAYLFSKKNYGPLNRLLDKATDVYKGHYEGAKNEFKFIENSMDNAIRERKIIDEILEHQNKVLKYNYLVRLIKGRIDSSIPMETSLASYGLSFFKEYFSVMIFYIEDYESFFSKELDKDISIEEKLKLVEFLFTNVVEDVVGKESQVHVVEVDGIICCLLNYDAENEHKAKDKLLEVARFSQSFIQEKLHIYFSVAISGNHREVRNINVAYQEALEAMEYRMINGFSTILCYSDIKVTENRYKYPLETEQMLINFTKAGDFEKAEAIVNEVFNENFTGNKLSIEMTKCLIFDIVGTLVKTIAEVKNNKENPFVEELYPIERLTKCANIVDMKKELISILNTVCNHVNKNKKKHNIVLRDEIIDFVNNNYYNVDLDVSMIANKFDLNQSYLSTFFKESFGQGLLEYINKVRIDNSKILLKQRSISIVDTASKVGFYNSNAFIRAFKKYEGITPGKYKEIFYGLEDKV
jgi:YesN/AraC family two-component response regulator